MSWPEPRRPLDGFAGAILVIAGVLIGAWLSRPVFEFLMNVLQ